MCPLLYSSIAFRLGPDGTFPPISVWRPVALEDVVRPGPGGTLSRPTALEDVVRPGPGGTLSRPMALEDVVFPGPGGT